MRKLTDKKIRWIIKQLNKGVPVKGVAAVMRVTPRRVYQLRREYNRTNRVSQLRSAGRKSKPITRETQQIILRTYHKYKLGPVTLEKIIEKEYGVHIPHNTIYKVMLDYNLVVENMSKRKQKKWVRFERDYSMSLWQGDWKKIGGKWLIAFMDDSSRLITCYGLFDSPTAENTIKVLEKGFADYGTPDEILTDHYSVRAWQLRTERTPNTSSRKS